MNRKKYVSVAVKATITLFLASNVQAKPDIAELTETHKQSIEKIQEIIELNNAFYVQNAEIKSSDEAVAKKFLQDFDSNKMVFTKKEYEDYLSRSKWVSEMKKGNFEGFISEMNLLLDISSKMWDYSIIQLKTPLNKELNQYWVSREKMSEYPLNESERNELWKLWVHQQKQDLIVGGKKEDEAITILTERFKKIKDNIDKMKTDEAVEMVMNSYVSTLDPHTNYFSPESAKDFEVSTTLSLHGVGMTLEKETSVFKIKEILPGGPVEKNGSLKIGDEIIGVSEGEDKKQKMIDISSYDITDVIKKIRGQEGTKVTLWVKDGENKNSSIRQVTLTRELIKIEDQAVKYWYDEEKKVGVIHVPSFYENPQKKEISVSADVLKALKEFESKNINNLVLDLRNNGGGSLRQAIRLTSYFIGENPVVMVREGSGRIISMYNDAPEYQWKGNMVTLVNGYSASASEITAGALQDYGRSIIVGEETFGKGTVQTLVPLERTEENKLGDFKFTTAQFFRPSGRSTQKRGVVPDILLETNGVDEERESSIDNAIEWARIAPAEDVEFKSVLPVSQRSIIKEKHLQRMNSNQDLIWWNKWVDFNNTWSNKNKEKISLNFNERMKSKEEFEKEKEILDQKRVEADLPKMDSKEWKNKDPVIRETINILFDFSSMNVDEKLGFVQKVVENHLSVNSGEKKKRLNALKCL